MDIWQDYRFHGGCQWGVHSMVVSGWPRQSGFVKDAAISSSDCQQRREMEGVGLHPMVNPRGTAHRVVFPAVSTALQSRHQPLKTTNMPLQYVFCHAVSRSQAGQIVDRLKAARFTSNDISALFSDHHRDGDFAQVKHTRAMDGTLAGAGTGGVVGGVLGWIASLGILAIPGLGPFIAAGPILAALSGAATGAFVGGISGGVIGMGIPKQEARRDKTRLQDGNILISVQTENAAEITRAEVIFAHAGAQDICTTVEATVPDDNLETEIIHYPTKSGLEGANRQDP